MTTTAELLSIAIAHHQAGRRAEAETLYREILRIDPKHPDALHLFGVIANERGDQQTAVEYISEAIALRPDIGEFHNNLGNALQALGDFEEALQAYQRALELKPDYATAHNNLGNARNAQGDLEGAIECYHRALTLQPEYPGALCNLGNALQAMGDSDEAIAAYRKALLLNPRFPEALNNLGNALHLKGANREAEDSYRGAIRWNPHYAEAHGNLGAVLHAEGRSDEAAAALHRAIQLQPSFAKSHATLGSVLAAQGELAEAVARFRESLRLNPALAMSYHELVNLAGNHACEVSEAEVATIRELLEAGPPSMDEASLLHFALAHHLDQQDECDEAFPHFVAGNNLRKEFLRRRNIETDDEKYLDIVDDIISVFDQSYFEQIASTGGTAGIDTAGIDTAGVDSQLPIFVVGMPRSGTTLVEQILASHPEVLGAGELKHISVMVGAMNDQPYPPQPYPACVRHMESDSLRLHAEGYLANLRSLGGSARRVVDKMPLNYNHLGLIATMFPAARVVHCRRDPLDTCMSCFMQHAVPASLEELAFSWRQYDKLMKHWVDVLPVPIYQLDYERLVNEQESVTRELIDFCGLDWNPLCLEFHQTNRAVRTPTKLEVRQPIYRHAIGRWRRYQSHLGPLIDALPLDSDV